MRTPFQGVWNIIRFNWHYYLLIAAALLALAGCTILFPALPAYIIPLTALGLLLGTFISLAVSYYIYDYSGLYSLQWLPDINSAPGSILLNIHAGFDETSALLQQKFPASQLHVIDFYDPAKHTEVSVSRARKAYPPYPGTLQATTSAIPAHIGPPDTIFLIFAAHEIRDNNERVAFFKLLKQNLKPGGHILIVEHRRDVANFMAYNIGFTHFLSAKTWMATFDQAELIVDKEWKLNPFVTASLLR